MDSTPHSQSSTITPRPKVGLDAASRDEKRALLAARIEELRARRRAADGAKNRQELMEIRRKKQEAKKERKKRRRLEVKAAEEAKRKEEARAIAASGGGGIPTSQQEQLKKGPANNFSFSTVTFDDGQELDATLTDFKKTRKPRGPSDVLGQLKHVETKKARIRAMAPEKQAKIEEQELWGKALKQAAGGKVRDDEQLLKKSLKRQERAKRKSKREWGERIENVAKSKAMKQKKREDNLAARREQKTGNSGKRAKVGGKKKKKGARPGFEGSMRSKHSRGGSGKQGRK